MKKILNFLITLEFTNIFIILISVIKCYDIFVCIEVLSTHLNNLLLIKLVHVKKGGTSFGKGNHAFQFLSHYTLPTGMPIDVSGHEPPSFFYGRGQYALRQQYETCPVCYVVSSFHSLSPFSALALNT